MGRYNRRSYGSETVDHGEVEIGEQFAVVRAPRSSVKQSVAIIGRQRCPETQAITRITLAAVVHPRGCSQLGPFRCSGVIGTELEPMTVKEARGY